MWRRGSLNLMRWLLLVTLSGCGSKTSSPSTQQHSGDGAAYVSCETLCLRPSDCEPAYNDDGYCPPGYLCAFTFQCVADGGASD
jgi:hypothetical protein